MPRAELERGGLMIPKRSGPLSAAPDTARGLIIQRSWLRYDDALPPRKRHQSSCRVGRRQEIGGANDWSVCTTWLLQDGKYHLVHVSRERLDYPSCGSVQWRTLAPTTPTKL